MVYARAAALTRQTGIVFLLALVLSACATGPESVVPEPVPTERPAPVVEPEPVFAPDPAPEARFRASAPKQYVVKEGDTLWDIANVFLRDPWYWSEIWLLNPQVRNPHRIYPGDVLTIQFVEDRPRVTVDLVPRIRIEALDTDPFPISTLQTFMFRPRVLDEQTLDAAPYVVAARDARVIYGPGDQVYVRNAPDAERFDLYHLVRRDRVLVDPHTGENLGIATIPIGEVEIIRGGEPATAIIRTGERESIRGDRLVGFDDDPNLLFDISRPPSDLEGEVILLFDAISQIGTYQAAVINRGLRDGVRDGQVFAVWEAGRTARDPISRTPNDIVQLPEEEIGTMMVFRTFDKVAYVLVIKSIRPIREGFKVRHP
jgi:hypothetical protein